MKQLNYIKLEFPARSVNEGFARAAAAAFAAQMDPTMEELGDVKTAVSEAVTNAIVHAYPDTVGTVQMRLRLLDGNTDVKKAMEPMFSTGGEERSGMGFTIMGSFMDSLRVRSAVDRGTTVTMSKRIRAKGS